MLREIAALSTLTGTPVPHPGFIAGCDDLNVLGVVFYLMELVDGFNPGDDMDDAYVRDPSMRHDVGLSYAASLAQLGNVDWEGSPLAELKRPGSFLERQVPQFLRLLESYRHDSYEPESLAVTELAEWLAVQPAARRQARNHAWRPASEQCSAAPRPPGVGGVRRLGDVHHRRPAAGPGVDVDLLAPGHVHHHRRGPTRRTGRTGHSPRTPRCLSRCGRPRNVNLNWYVAMACFKLGIVIEGTWSRYLMGQASREAGEALHASAQNLIDVGTRVAKGDNPFDLSLERCSALAR